MERDEENMINQEQEIERLKSEGYDPVYVWTAEPNEHDPEHSHDFDTHLVVLEGNIEVIMNDAPKILTSGDTVDIPSGTIHSGLVGKEGCTYIVYCCRTTLNQGLS